MNNEELERKIDRVSKEKLLLESCKGSLIENESEKDMSKSPMKVDTASQTYFESVSSKCGTSNEENPETDQSKLDGVSEELLIESSTESLTKEEDVPKSTMMIDNASQTDFEMVKSTTAVSLKMQTCGRRGSMQAREVSKSFVELTTSRTASVQSRTKSLPSVLKGQVALSKAELKMVSQICAYFHMFSTHAPLHLFTQTSYTGFFLCIKSPAVVQTSIHNHILLTNIWLWVCIYCSLPTSHVSRPWAELSLLYSTFMLTINFISFLLQLIEFIHFC